MFRLLISVDIVVHFSSELGVVTTCNTPQMGRNRSVKDYNILPTAVSMYPLVNVKFALGTVDDVFGL